jgi:O-succinylhomoserine sulfhydrylase
MTDAPDNADPPITLRPQTLLSRGGTERSLFGETSEAIFMTSGYVYKRAEDAERAFAKPGTAYVYSRYANPTVTMFEERLRLIEGAEACRGLASGMAAVFAALACYVKAGDRVVASRALFGSCDYIIKQILPGYGVTTELVDGRDLGAWEKALSRPAKAVFVESISNPALEIVDIEAVAKLTHRAGGLLFVDNVFATPLLMKPLRLGADIVIYSATKHIDGQGRSLGGAILGPTQWMTDHLANFLRHTGPSLSPFNAWVLLKGMETLDLRVERMSRSAALVAAFLEQHPKIARVLYPGLESHPQRALAARQIQGGGTLLAFSVMGGKEAAFRCLNALKLILISNNLGDARSLVTHPATTTHFRLKPEERTALGIDDGMVRLSVGLEDPADLTDDLDRALAAV